VGSDWDILSDPLASNGKYVTVKAGTQSLNQAPTDSGSAVIIPFSVDTAGIFSVFGRVNCPTANDDSYWVKMDDGAFQMDNGLGTSGWEWKKLNDFNLTKGNHTLTIAYREDGAELDKLAVTNSVYAPVGMGEEAENICSPTGVKNLKEVPDAYALEQNYPNPFNPATVIKYSVPRYSFISLKVFDVIGNEVAVLVNGMKQPGNYAVPFNGSGLASGVYIYQLKADGFVDSKKLILLK
jgi:hypothetical protein